MADAGMCALWNPERFATIVDYDTWARELSTDDAILRRLRRGALVPLNLGFDSGFGVTVRLGPCDTAVLTERETRYLVVSSDPYLYMSDGQLCVSGLEHIRANPDTLTVTRITLAPGRYQVTAHLLDWEAEPGAKDETGRATA
jgi:hypothetical protein